ncbi:MAG: hypothetical protein Q7K21_02290 [Elusimicrobiota bacterium]|nr:hypothetical protein [Elusimicrobiota bacterium]
MKKTCIFCLLLIGCATGPNAKNQTNTQTGATTSGNVEIIASQRDTVKGETVTINNYDSFEKKELINMLEERDKKIELINKKLLEIEKYTAPNTLSLYNNLITKIKSGYSLLLQFKSSKNEPLGQLVFVASIPKNSNARILDFWPSNKSGVFAFESGIDSKQIAEDGKTARLIYSLISAGNPEIELKVSEITQVIITGNYIENNIEISMQ